MVSGDQASWKRVCVCSLDAHDPLQSIVTTLGAHYDALKIIVIFVSNRNSDVVWRESLGRRHGPLAL
jgi:hypothetical protein